MGRMNEEWEYRIGGRDGCGEERGHGMDGEEWERDGGGMWNRDRASLGEKTRGQGGCGR